MAKPGHRPQPSRHGTRRPRLAIVGLGLLGGSIALALKQPSGRAAAADWHVTGVALDEATIERAFALEAIDEGTTDVRAGVAEAEIVVFATPVRTIPKLVARCATAFKPGAIITDVGSTKAELSATLPALLPPGVHYVGGHPMAGSEQTGIDAAHAYLFENAIYVVTPKTPEDPALQPVLNLVNAVGAQALVMDPERHDRVVAAVSHLPHMIAAALVDTVGVAAEEDATVLALAAGGFRDTTRVASGDPHMWRDIFMSNRKQVLNMIDRFDRVLRSLRHATASDDDAALIEALTRARTIREQLPRHRQGILRPMCEIVVQLADEPGGISAVTGGIAAKDVNIKDIEVLRVREGEPGALRLAFEDEDGMETALTALADIGFIARKRG